MSYSPKVLRFPVAWRTSRLAVTAAEQTVTMEQLKTAQGAASLSTVLVGLGFSDATSDQDTSAYPGFGGHSPVAGAGYGCDHGRFYTSRVSGTNIGAGIVNNTPSIRYRCFDANALLSYTSLWVI